MKKFFGKIMVILFLIAVISPALYAKYLRVYYVLWGNGAWGDCIFIELPNGENVLIDGGGGSTTAGSWVDDFLSNRGVTTINHMVLTHPHDDHYPGLQMVMDNYQVENFYCTGQDEVNIMGTVRIQNEGCNVYKISDFGGSPWNWYLSGTSHNYVGPNWDSAVDVRVLAADNSTSDPNSRSLVLKVSLGDSTFFFGGDATDSVETSIHTNVSEAAPIDVFKANHHASGGSNSQNFINWMKPKFSVIPSGGRSAEPPAEATLKRIMDSKIIIYATYLDGTVLVKADESGNYDIVRMNAVETVTLNDYYSISPKPKAFPEHSYAGDFLVSSNMPYVLPPPTAPAGLEVLSREKTSVTLNWTSDSALKGYFVYYSTQPGGDSGANNGWKNAGMSEETGIYIRDNDSPFADPPYTVSGLYSDVKYYFRLSSLNNYYYERRYSQETSTKTKPSSPPSAITTLSGFCFNSSGDIALSWIAPYETIDDTSSATACENYYVRYATFSFKSYGEPNTYEIKLDSAPLPPPRKESFILANFPGGTTRYIAVFGANKGGVLGGISNIASFYVDDSSSPAEVNDLSVSRNGSSGNLELSWTMTGDNGFSGNAEFCRVLYSSGSQGSVVKIATVTAQTPWPYTLKSPGKTQKFLLSVPSEIENFKRYRIEAQTYDEAGNFSTSTAVFAYAGKYFVETPDFSNRVDVSVSTSLSVAFKIEIDTKSVGGGIGIREKRDNLGSAMNNYKPVGESTETVSFSAFSSSAVFNFNFNANHYYEIEITTSLLDIDGFAAGEGETFDFLTKAKKSEENVFFKNPFDLTSASITVPSGSFSSFGWVEFSASPLDGINGAYNRIASSYTVVSGSEGKFTTHPENVTAIIPVSGGIPYIYNAATLSFEKASSEIINGETVFRAKSPAIYLFVTASSFVAKKDAGIYAYPVPCVGQSITFTNLRSPAEVEIFTISGRRLIKERVSPDPVTKEWVWKFSGVSPGLYFWVVNGSDKGLLMIK